MSVIVRSEYRPCSEPVDLVIVWDREAVAVRSKVLECREPRGHGGSHPDPRIPERIVLR